jgi:serine phosphatase RsbU (regulator of sigma subunit)
VLFHTDGITALRRPGGSLYGDDELVDNVERVCAEGLTPSESVRRLMHSFVDERGAAWADDACVVMVAWTPPLRSGT